MSKLKLPKLPDRTPVKLTLTISPDLNRKLARYAEMYNDVYGNAEPEPVTELVPYMLEGFLNNDKTFVRDRNRKPEAPPVAAAPAPARRSA